MMAEMIANYSAQGTSAGADGTGGSDRARPGHQHRPAAASGYLNEVSR